MLFFPFTGHGVLMTEDKVHFVGGPAFVLCPQNDNPTVSRRTISQPTLVPKQQKPPLTGPNMIVKSVLSVKSSPALIPSPGFSVNNFKYAPPHSIPFWNLTSYWTTRGLRSPPPAMGVMGVGKGAEMAWWAALDSVGVRRCGGRGIGKRHQRFEMDSRTFSANNTALPFPNQTEQKHPTHS